MESSINKNKVQIVLNFQKLNSYMMFQSVGDKQIYVKGHYERETNARRFNNC